MPKKVTEEAQFRTIENGIEAQIIAPLVASDRFVQGGVLITNHDEASPVSLRRVLAISANGTNWRNIHQAQRNSGKASINNANGDPVIWSELPKQLSVPQQANFVRMRVRVLGGDLDVRLRLITSNREIRSDGTDH